MDPDTRKILRVEMAGTPEHQPGVFPRWLAGQGVHTVIAEGIGHRALALMGQLGIQVRAGLAEATVEDLVAALMDGRLSGSPMGCEHHGHDHDHEHGNGHGHGHGHGHARAPGL